MINNTENKYKEIDDIKLSINAINVMTDIPSCMSTHDMQEAKTFIYSR